MKIANILRRFSFQEWGGTETAVWNSSMELSKRGNKIEILSTDALSPLRSETREGIVIRRFPYFYPHLGLKSFAVNQLDKKGGNPFSPKLYRELKNSDADIFHCHTMGRMAKEVCKASKLRKIPYVVSFHGGCYDVPKSEFEEMAKPLRGSLGYGRIIEKLFGLDFDIVRSADGVICVGANEYEIIKRKFPDKPAAVIPNGVDCDKFAKPAACNFRKANGIDESAKLILCVSRIDYQKNQRALVELVKRLKAEGENVHCAIVGFVSSASYFKELKDDISREGLDGNFTIIRGLDPSSRELLSAYKAADIFVLPSVHEPFGIVALEAWSAGVPLAASAVGGLKTIISDGKNAYLFDCKNADSMLSAYRNALANKDAIAKNALSEVREKYSWASVAKRLEDFYGEVLKSVGR